MATVSEKRLFKRIRYPLPVGCLGQFEVFEGKIENLSLNGACLNARQRLEQGGSLFLIFRLPTRDRPFVLFSRVLWAQQENHDPEARYGIQYLWLSPGDRNELLRFLHVFKDENLDRPGE